MVNFNIFKFNFQGDGKTSKCIIFDLQYKRVQLNRDNRLFEIDNTAFSDFVSKFINIELLASS